MDAPEIFFIESLGSLYTDVQTQKIFPDSKYFVDCTPREKAAALLKLYEKEKQQPGFDLKQFVTDHFIFPVAMLSMYRSGNKPILQHLDELWIELSREPAVVQGGTLIPLPFPYVVPGGRFREIYYWDSYFTMLGLQVSGKLDAIEHMVENFAYLVDRFGFIPNGNRTYYLSRSQPPFFTLMVELLAAEKGSDTLLKYLPQIEKEYRFWMEGEEKLTATNNAYRHVVKLPDGSVLNRYWDEKQTARAEAYREDSLAAGKSTGDLATAHSHIRAACESGWDFSSRWFRDGKNIGTIQTTLIAPVDLNCLLLHTEEVLQRVYALKEDKEKIAYYQQKAAVRKNAIQQYCWNEEQGFYFDYHFLDQAVTDQYTLAAVYPLFFSVATAAQAAAVAGHIEKKFLREGGLLTTLNKTGQQWDLPNGWAPLQWMAYKALKDYGHTSVANLVKQYWMGANERIYAATGKMMEKYDVTDISDHAGGGEYPNQDGFGWTNGVYLKLSREK